MTTNKLFATAAVVLMIAGSSFMALADTAAIGMVSAQGGVTLNNAKISSNATLFDGTAVQATGYSRLKLTNGTRLDLGAGASAKIYANHAVLSSGMTEIQSRSGFQLDTNAVNIRTSVPGSVARVRIDGTKGVLVTALNAPVDVFNRTGLLVARVMPGLPLSFLPHTGSAGAFDSTGCVVQKSVAALVVDANGSQTYELRGADLRKVVGNTAHVVGTVETGASPAGGAAQVVKVTSVVVTRKGGCSAAAAKVGGMTAAAGLAAAASSGVAATTVGVAAVAAAGISTTALVVGGVAATSAVGLGAAAASDPIDGSGP